MLFLLYIIVYVQWIGHSNSVWSSLWRLTITCNTSRHEKCRNDKNDRKVETKFMENYFGKFVDLFSSIQFIVALKMNAAPLQTHTNTHIQPIKASIFPPQFVIAIYLSIQAKFMRDAFVCVRTRLYMAVVDYIRMNCKEIKSMQNRKYLRHRIDSLSLSLHFYNYCKSIWTKLCTMRIGACVRVCTARGHQVIHINDYKQFSDHQHRNQLRICMTLNQFNHFIWMRCSQRKDGFAHL